MVLLTIGCGISCSSFLSLATFAENSCSPGKSRFIAILGVFRLETAVDSRVTKMAITRFRGSETRGTFDHRMRNFLLFVFVSRNIC